MGKPLLCRAQLRRGVRFSKQLGQIVGGAGMNVGDDDLAASQTRGPQPSGRMATPADGVGGTDFLAFHLTS